MEMSKQENVSGSYTHVVFINRTYIASVLNTVCDSNAFSKPKQKD